MVDIMQGKEKLYMDIEISYESKTGKYFYKAKYEFNPDNGKWVILEGDAN